MASQGTHSFVDDELLEYPIEDEGDADIQQSIISSVTSKVRGRK